LSRSGKLLPKMDWLRINLLLTVRNIGWKLTGHTPFDENINYKGQSPGIILLRLLASTPFGILKTNMARERGTEMPEKYWDDFKMGDKRLTQGITITESHLINWAGLTMEFNPMHVDEEFSKKTPFGTRVPGGLLILSLSFGLVGMTDIFKDSIIAWVGLENFKMITPARVGDTIKVEVEVKEKRETSKPEKGLTILTYDVKNQRDQDIMAVDVLLLMHKRTS
jgi:itaconyl-CoA hydratase